MTTPHREGRDDPGHEPVRGRDDPLDALRGAWTGLGPPAPADDAADTDELTRAVVAWMRAAHRRVEAPARTAPPARAPRALPARRAAPAARLPSIARPLAAAAVVVVALLGTLLVTHPSTGPDGAPRRRPDAVGPADRGAPAIRPGDRHGRDAAADAAPAHRPPETPARPLVAAADSHHLELRSGPVRLLLVTDAGRAAAP